MTFVVFILRIIFHFFLLFSFVLFSLLNLNFYLVYMTIGHIDNQNKNSRFYNLHIINHIKYITRILIEIRLKVYITNLVCYTYFHWFFSPECQHIFGKQTGYIFQSPKTIKTWTTKHYASLNQWYNTE